MQINRTEFLDCRKFKLSFVNGCLNMRVRVSRARTQIGLALSIFGGENAFVAYDSFKMLLL